MRPEALYRRIQLGHKANVKFEDFETLLAAFGYRYDGGRGSHRIYRHEETEARLPIQPDHNGDAKGYQVAEFLNQVRKYRLRMG